MSKPSHTDAVASIITNLKTQHGSTTATPTPSTTGFHVSVTIQHATIYMAAPEPTGGQ